MSDAFKRVHFQSIAYFILGTIAGYQRRGATSSAASEVLKQGQVRVAMAMRAHSHAASMDLLL